MDLQNSNIKLFLHSSIVEMEKEVRGCLPLYCYLALWNTRNNLCYLYAKDALEFMGVQYQNNGTVSIRNLNAALLALKNAKYINYDCELTSIKDSLIIECNPDLFVIKKQSGGKGTQFIQLSLNTYYRLLHHESYTDNSEKPKVSFYVLLHIYVALHKHMWTKHASHKQADWKNDPLVAVTTFDVLAHETGKRIKTCSNACSYLKELGVIYYSTPIKLREAVKGRQPVSYSTIFVDVAPASESQFEWQIEYLYGYYKYVDRLETEFAKKGMGINILTSCPKEIIDYWQRKKARHEKKRIMYSALTITADEAYEALEYQLPMQIIDEELPF